MHVIQSSASLGAVPTSVEQLEAKIQSHVGKFLVLKEQLLDLRDQARTSAERAHINMLYQQQIKLEPIVQDAIAKLKDMNRTGYNFASAIDVAAAATQMEIHTKKVKQYQAQLSKPATSPWQVKSWDITTWLMAGGLVLGIVRMVRR